MNNRWFTRWEMSSSLLKEPDGVAMLQGYQCFDLNYTHVSNFSKLFTENAQCIVFSTKLLQWRVPTHQSGCAEGSHPVPIGGTMGRVIRREVIALRCELRSCEATVPIGPIPLGSPTDEEAAELRGAVAQGWSLVLTPQLRSYCPVHAWRVQTCTCRTNPDRAHLCVHHAPDIAALVQHVPPRWLGAERPEWDERIAA